MIVLKSKIKVINAHKIKSKNLLELGIISTYPPKICPITLRKCRISIKVKNLTESLTWRRLKAPKDNNERDIVILEIKSKIQPLFIM